MSVGIDIGSKTIKIVELSREGTGWKLRSAGIVGYTGGDAVDRLADETRIVALSDAIRKLHKEARISSKEISVALPETNVFTRVIKFPVLSDTEIASAVRWEAEQYIPIPVDEAVIQHQILERRETTTPPEMSVLLIAAPKKLVEKYVHLMESAGLSVIFVETELISLSRALAPPDQTVLIADLGARSTNMAIVKNGRLVVARSIPTAGEAFTRALAQGLGLEKQQAEEYKKAYGLSVNQLEGKIKGILDPVFRMVSDEMKKAVHYYQSEEGGEPPRSVILSGGTAAMPDAVGVLTKLLGIEVIIGNPFARIAIDPESAKTIYSFAPLYSVACGLAMRGD